MSPLEEVAGSNLLAPLEQKIVSESSWAGETLPNTLMRDLVNQIPYRYCRLGHFTILQRAIGSQ